MIERSTAWLSASEDPDRYQTHYRTFLRYCGGDKALYEVLKRCSLCTRFSRGAYESLAGGLGYSLDRLLEYGFVDRCDDDHIRYQVPQETRLGAWAAWWQEAGNTAVRPKKLSDSAMELARHLESEGGAAAAAERIRLLVVADRIDEATALFDRWYADAVRVGHAAAGRRFKDAIAPAELRAFVGDQGLHEKLRSRQERAAKQLSMMRVWYSCFRRTWHYVARPHVEGALEAALHAEDPHAPRVVHLHGPGGIGKSTQISWLIARHCAEQDPPVPCAMRDVDTLDSTRLLRHPSLLLVEFARQLLRQLPPASPESGTARLHDLVYRHGKLLDALDREYVDGTALHPEAVEPPEPLTDEFCAALEDVVAEAAERPRRTVVLCLDTLDELLGTAGFDMRPLFDVLAAVTRVDRVRLVLSGRADIAEHPQFSQAFGRLPGRWRSLEVPPFTLENAAEYLRTRGIDEPLANRIVTACREDFEGAPGFTPLVLALMADLALDQPDELPRARMESLELFVLDRELHGRHPRIELALRYCAVARHPTYEYFRQVLVPLLSETAPGGPDLRTDEAADDLWKELLTVAHSSAWMRTEEKRQLVVHVNVRRALRHDMRNHHGDAWWKLHHDGKDRCARLAAQARDNGSETAAEWTIEQIYHELHSAADPDPDRAGSVDEAARVWREAVADAWRRGALLTVLKLAERLLSSDFGRQETELGGPQLPDPRTMTAQLWYDIALERAYGELHAVLYDGRPGWPDVARYYELACRRATMSPDGEPPPRPDERRMEILRCALLLGDPARAGAGTLDEVREALAGIFRERGSGPGTPGRGRPWSAERLDDLWRADAGLLYASCLARTGPAPDGSAAGERAADGVFTTTYDWTAGGADPRALLIARYAMREWRAAGRPDLVRAWKNRFDRAALRRPEEAGPQRARAALADMEAALRSGVPVDGILGMDPGTDSMSFDVLEARARLLRGEPLAAVHLLDHTVQAFVDPDDERRRSLGFDAHLIRARAWAGVLEPNRAEDHAQQAMILARDDEERLRVLALRADLALSALGDLAQAHRWIGLAAPLRSARRGRAGSEIARAECALLHRLGRPEAARRALAAWKDALLARTGERPCGGPPPAAPDEWFAQALHSLVHCDPAAAAPHLDDLRTALTRIPDPGRRLVLVAEEAALYGPFADAPLLPEPVREPVVRLLGRLPDERTTVPLSLAAVVFHGHLLGDRRRAAAHLKAARQRHGAPNHGVHRTWLLLHRLLPPGTTPAPWPEQERHEEQLTALRGADLLAQESSRRRRPRREMVVDAADLLGDGRSYPTVWHLAAAELTAPSDPATAQLRRRLLIPSDGLPRTRNLEFARRALRRHGGSPAEVRTASAADLKESLTARVPERTPRWELLVPGGAPAKERTDAPVDVLVLRGVMRPFGRGAALRLLDTAVPVRPADVHREIRELCLRHDRPPPLVLLDAVRQGLTQRRQTELRDLFAHELFLLGRGDDTDPVGGAAVVLAAGLVPVEHVDSGAWDATWRSAVLRFGRTAVQAAAELDSAVRELTAADCPAPPVRLFSHLPEEEMFGLGRL
ncbi:AAA family ATPase [Streptomyces sp. NPDC002328]|uniref:AAA family ATPase n=1 Tax=Streptomyces sp. NPDC002328 TaxID=3364642 RepID=UPI003699A4BD